MYKDAKIYIAGHTGLIGSALLRKLKEKKYSNILTKTHDELELTDTSCVFDFFDETKPDYVFLSAGKVGGILSNRTSPADYFHTNIAIQDNIFEAARRFTVKHVVFYASSCTYPKQSPQPMKEEYLLTGPIEQTSASYAAAKIAGLYACRAYNKQYDNNCFIALLPNSAYGPNDNFDLEDSHVLSALIRKFHEASVHGIDTVTLWGSGLPKREFIYSEDVAEASIFAVENAEIMENTHYNIGTGTDYSIRELAEMIAAVTGYKGKIIWDKTKPDGAMQKLLDSTRFLSLGWKPKTDLREGLKKTFQWYKDNCS